MKNVRLVIFDFDGTLADTAPVILATYAATISRMGLEPRAEAECRATIGLPLDRGFCALFPAAEDSMIDCCVDTYRTLFEQNHSLYPPVLFPGVADTLAALQRYGVIMSIASSRSYGSLVRLCGECGISRYFDLILGVDNVAEAKPSPEPVLHTLRAFDVEASSAVVVGDMPVDVSMGRGAGCATVGVTYGNAPASALRQAGADFLISDMGQLLMTPNFTKFAMK